MSLRASPGWLLVWSIAACASSSAGREEAPAPVAPSVPAAERVQPAPISEAERVKMLDAACGEHAKFAELVLASDAKPARDRIARLYIERCALGEAIELTSKLIEFPTVSAREPATGDSFRAMARFLEEWSREAGLEFRVSGENDVWELALGRGTPHVGFVMHGDVVPIDDGIAVAEQKTGAIDRVTGEPLPPGWSKPPFRGTLEDGRLYGRGSEDDKGPIAAVMVVMRTLAKLGVGTRGTISAIIGNGEEHDWAGMRRYVEATKPLPAFVVSLDASFPVVVAESGFVAWQLGAPLGGAVAKGSKRCVNAAEAIGGQFLTQVPGDASMLLVPPATEAPERLLARVREAVAPLAPELEGKMRVVIAPAGGRVQVTVIGEAVHSSVAEDGQNALWGLAAVAERVGLCDGGIKSILTVVAKYFRGDHFGERLKLAYEHPTMGRLLVAPTMLRIENGEVRLSINMRRPAGRSVEEFRKMLDSALEALKKSVDRGLRQVEEPYVGEPALADTEGPLVPTLMEIYRRESGDTAAKPISIRGGTYARLFPGAVSFGPALPGRPYRGHAPDEYLEIDSLSLLLRTTFEAALALDALAIMK